MTSFGDKRLTEGNFLPTLKIQGPIYHLIGTLIPDSNANPNFLQIYFMGNS